MVTSGICKFQEGKLYCVCYACRVSVAACNVCVDVLVGVNVSVIMCILVWIPVRVRMYSSTHSCGCVADGGDAMAAF